VSVAVDPRLIARLPGRYVAAVMLDTSLIDAGDGADCDAATAWWERWLDTYGDRRSRASAFDWPEADRPCIRCEAREACHTPECRLAGASTMDSHRWVCGEYL
jgi:hypothetical protein